MNIDVLWVSDRDGTLTRAIEVTNPKYADQIHHPSHLRHSRDFCLYPGVAKTLAKLDPPVLVLSNQGGIAGDYPSLPDAKPPISYKTVDGVVEEMIYLMELAPSIQKCYWSPGRGHKLCYTLSQGDSSPEIIYGEEEMHKPAPGMLRQIWLEWQPKKIVYVGDRPEDRLLVHNAVLEGINAYFIDAKQHPLNTWQL